MSDKFNKKLYESLVNELIINKANTGNKDSVRNPLTSEEEIYLKDEEPIVKDFIQNGIKITTLEEISFLGKYKDNKDSIRLALEWLENTSNQFIISDLLTIIYANKYLKENAKTAIEKAIYYWENAKPVNHDILDITGNIILKTADKSVYSKLISMIRENKYAAEENDMFNYRWYFVEAIGKMRGQKGATDELIGLLKDKQLYPSAIKALGNLKDPGALPHLRPFLKHESADIRKYTTNAIAKIEKAQEKASKKNK